MNPQLQLQRSASRNSKSKQEVIRPACQSNFQSLMAYIVKLMDRTFQRNEEKQVEALLKQQKQLTEHQITVLQSTAHQVKRLASNKKILDKIEDYLKQELKNPVPDLSPVANINQFYNYLQLKKQQKVGVSIIDEDGHFIMFDDMTRDLLECTNEWLKDHSLFEIMFPLSLKRIQMNGPTILHGSQMNAAGISFSIYSERNRKRLSKYLQKLKKQHLDSQQKRKNKKLQEDDYQPIDVITCKYLKTLIINVRRTHICFKNEPLDQLDLVLNKVYLPNEQNFQAVLVEMRESEELEQFSKDELLEDKKIQKYERKFQVKLERLTNDILCKNLYNSP